MIDGGVTEAYLGRASKHDPSQRRNNRQTPERNYPNIVELPLPFGGLRETSFAIDAFHRDAFHRERDSEASMVEATMTKDHVRTLLLYRSDRC